VLLECAAAAARRATPPRAAAAATAGRPPFFRAPRRSLARSLAEQNLNLPPPPPGATNQSQIGVAVGALAILDQRLRTIPFVYDGPNPRYAGQTARIEYCLLSSSSSTLSSAQQARCGFATAAPAASLGLSLLWVLVRGFARERAPGASPANAAVATRVAESAIAGLGAAWWLACGVVVSLWTSQANRAGDPDLPGADWRNTMSFLYWLNFLLFLALTGTSVILAYLAKMRAAGRVPPSGPWRKPKGAAAAAAAVTAPGPAPAPAAPMAPPVALAPPQPVAMAPPQPVAHAAHTAVDVAPPAAHREN